MEHLLQLHGLRRILSIVTLVIFPASRSSPLGVVCIPTGMRASTPPTFNIQLWAVIHAATDVYSAKPTPKDVIYSDNYFNNIEPSDSYILPRIAHYDGPLDPNSIAAWLRDRLGITPYVARAHFRPFLCRARETSPGEHHQEFSTDQLYLDEAVAPATNDSPEDYPEDGDWSPSRGRHFHLPLHLSPRMPQPMCHRLRR